MKSAEITRRWLNFFKGKGHAIVPSAPLISEDPTVMFVIAGMVPFTPYLTGSAEAPYKRAASVQKCIRTLDIDEVGKTARHGTFFQMAGNFSFGDYFKKEAIGFAWELLTGEQAQGGFGIDPQRLWVTVYEEDQEAYDIWHHDIGVPMERIQRMGKKENFWSTGKPGPAGPDSEIFYDRGERYGAEGGPAVDDDRYVEIWNLVFMQYERGEGIDKENFKIVGELPKKNIDTGLGVERLAMILQGVENFYETDQVRPVLDKAAEISGKHYRGRENSDEDSQDDVRLRVVADHVRSGLMLLADGVTPSNEGRGYILRRLLRRAVRSMHLLGVDGACLPRLLPIGRDAMQDAYPDILNDFDRISNIAYREEKTFLRTLVAGTTRLEEAVAETRALRKNSLSGRQAFELHDTYGFPIEITLEMAAEAGITVDEQAFQRQMQEQRRRAREDALRKRQGQADVKIFRDVLTQGDTVFRGYEELTVASNVRALIKNGQHVSRVKQGDEIDVILDATPFYAEAGGQAADRGVIRTDSAILDVNDVQRPVRGLTVHKAVVREGELGKDAMVTAAVNPERRKESAQAHTATHLLHAALHQALGRSANQAGSFNKPGYLRFDFSWAQSLSDQARTEIEEMVNVAVHKDFDVLTSVMSLNEAKRLGATMLFGDSYGDRVRVVEINGAWSRELCAGTHVDSTSQIGSFSLLRDQSVGGGNRRIEAYVGLDSARYAAQERALLAQVADALKVPPRQVPERIDNIAEKLKKYERELERIRQEKLAVSATSFLKKATVISGVTAVLEDIGEVASAETIRTLTVDLRARLGERPSLVAIVGTVKDKPVVVAATSTEARRRGVKAGAVVRTMAQRLGGGGGGNDELAQGGGRDIAKIDDSLKAAEMMLGSL